MMNVGRLQGFNVSVCVCVCVCVCDVMSPSCLSALVRMRVRAPVEWRVLRLSSPWRFGDVRCSVCSRSVVMRAFLSVMLLVHTRVHDLVRKFGVHVHACKCTHAPTRFACCLQGKITAQGKLLLQGTLLCIDQSAKAKQTDNVKMEERRVFLFEQIIIFSKETEKRKNNLSQPGYIFRSSLKVNIVLTFLARHFGYSFSTCIREMQYFHKHYRLTSIIV